MRVFRASFLLILLTPIFNFVTSLTLAPVTVAQAQNLPSADDLRKSTVFTRNTI